LATASVPGIRVLNPDFRKREREENRHVICS
jgi:hypothetical protein